MHGRIPALLTLAAAVSGCSSIVNIDVDDSDQFNDVEFVIPLPENEYHLRIRGTSIDGKFSQSLDSDERINIEGQPVIGPTEIDGEYELTYWSLAVGFDHPGNPLAAGQSAVIGYVGIGISDFDLSLSDAGSLVSVADEQYSIYLQYRFVQAVTDSFSFGFGAAAELGAGFGGSREYELFLDYELFERLRVTGGYRWYDFFYFSDESDSDIEFSLHGPFVGLLLPI